MRRVDCFFVRSVLQCPLILRQPESFAVSYNAAKLTTLTQGRIQSFEITSELFQNNRETLQAGHWLTMNYCQA